jgi:protein tyrosine/serine phosphatase
MVTPPNRFRAAVVALTLTFSIASLGLADAQTVAVPGIGIDNFAKVNDGYYRGAQPQGADYADLARIGVKTVVNLIGDDDLDDEEEQNVEKHGMRYVNIPMSTRVNPTPKQLEQFLAVVNDPDNQPVYVHCVGGRHRTGVMTAVYRMTRDGISGEAAFKEMKQYKYGADFLHPEFKKFVRTFEVKKPAAAVATHQQ